MKFGLFEHMDDSGVPLGQQFEDRLSLLEGVTVTDFTLIISPSITGRNSVWHRRPVYFSRPSRSEPNVFGLVPFPILFRSIIPSD